MSHHSDDMMSSDSVREPGNYNPNDLIQLIQERVDIEKAYAKSLKGLSKKWRDFMEKGMPPPGHGGPPQPPQPHVNPAFFQQGGGGPPQPGAPGGPQGGPPLPHQPPPGSHPPPGVVHGHGPPPPGAVPHGYHPPPPAQRPPPPPAHVPPISEPEFEEIMRRNRTVSSSAIARAVSDAAAGEYASAIETLVTAISLIEQSKVANDDRCKILISSLQDTLHGVEAKSYGSSRRERSRSRDRERGHRRRDRRDRSRSRDREYRERSRERDRDRDREREREKDRYYAEAYVRERSRSRDRERDREYRYRSREDRYYAEAYVRERSRSRDPYPCNRVTESIDIEVVRTVKLSDVDTSNPAGGGGNKWPLNVTSQPQQQSNCNNNNTSPQLLVHNALSHHHHHHHQNQQHQLNHQQHQLNHHHALGSPFTSLLGTNPASYLLGSADPLKTSLAANHLF